ncbi:MAG: electron transport complex subunit RsxC [bacterium]|nr:electron transport complex subunit RsxC [bacterium]
MKTFEGGIHPKEYKELTEDLKIEKCPLPDTVYLPLYQNIGAYARPVVKAGDIVEEGDLVAEADGFISAPIHTPVSGKIKKISRYPHIAGINVDTIVIERDKTVKPRTWERKKIKFQDISKDDFIKIIKDKGIVGLGGAGFPTYVKFLTKEGQKIDKVLINACECESYVNCDYRSMLEDTERFIEGMRLIKYAFNIKEVIIGVENNKPEAIKKIEEKLSSVIGIRVEPLKTKYPQGGEKMLVKALIDKEVPRGGLPLNVGVVVVNVNTVVAIANAVFYDKPILEKILTVSGKGINKQKNLCVKLGTPFSEIIDFCGGLNKDAERLVVGGPMMGIALSDYNIPIIKTTTGLLALTKKETGNTKIEPCLRCGDCVTQCPMGLVPCELAKYIEHGRVDLAEKTGMLDCMECGTCVYCCPSNRPIVQLIKVGKLKKRQADIQKKG